MEEELLLGTAGAGSREEAAPVTEGGRAGLWKERETQTSPERNAHRRHGAGEGHGRSQRPVQAPTGRRPVPGGNEHSNGAGGPRGQQRDARG